MSTHRHEIHRKGRALPGEFGTLFDWSPVTPETVSRPLDDSLAVDALRRACAAHLERGGLIVRYLTGTKLVKVDRADYGKDIPAGPLKAEYEATKHTDPLGAVLDGTPYGAGSIADAVRLLGVDEYWIVGFLHGLDKTPPVMTEKRFKDFDESPSYKCGHAAAREIAAEFIQIKGGWEVEKQA